jgi:hypothetical protein
MSRCQQLRHPLLNEFVLMLGYMVAVWRFVWPTVEQLHIAQFARFRLTETKLKLLKQLF